MRLGIDIGSTTIKLALLSHENELIYTSYERHHSKINEKLLECLFNVREHISFDRPIKVAITGSGAMGLSDELNIGFVQEVFATKVATDFFAKGTDVVIELGGEDAKILFLTSGLEVRMNGTCAGGTGAFIDQISTLLHITPNEMNELAKNAEKIYPIASRCGVFAKSDIQPLLNQGAKKEDLSASIFASVVNQTIIGLAQGRDINGNILYLGGPLTYLSKLRDSFDSSLNLKGLLPENSLYFVSLGSAISAKTIFYIDELIEKIKNYSSKLNFDKTEALFNSRDEYDEFINRHSKEKIAENDETDYAGEVFIGIDAGSTTIKGVVIDEQERILFSDYRTNGGNPLPSIKSFLEEFYEKHPRAQVKSSAVTGYGEEMIKNAFGIDYGIVETIAHFTSAKKFDKNVDFIIDIGGQDMKCFKISDGVIDDIFLNEACSSGCGSFLQSFASVLGYDAKEFAKLGLFADAPVDLGSRCTVFMNSSVKQAQKDGASIENISAGLSISVVKNAIYKVIRATSASDLGKNIVVQGGTFLSDAVLRAFEKEIGGNVIRPNIAGIMGAYGCALFSKQKPSLKSTLISKNELLNFTHNVTYTHCKACTNNCELTINDFDGKRKFIAGNRCDTPIKSKKTTVLDVNLYEYKRDLLKKYFNIQIDNARGTIGIPMVLNMYELLPFWSKFFETLGFNVKTSGFSDSETYIKGQHSIPSDTICYPAKLAHGHIESLDSVDAIFYPCMSYNLDEGKGDNHFNCPVVAYYPETIANNVAFVKQTKYIFDYVGLHRPKDFVLKIHKILLKYFTDISLKEIKTASSLAFLEYENYLSDIKNKGDEIVLKARQANLPIMVLSGRPYHLDSKVNHGIDKLIATYNVAVISEDSVCHKVVEKASLSVLNQWTYHARLYDASRYISTQNDMNLIQFVSFGCGVDSITTDEVRAILKRNNKIYTQLKIDEITNLGATKIRIRSLLEALQQKEQNS